MHKLRIVMIGFGAGLAPLNEGKRPTNRVVRVALGTGYNPGEGNRPRFPETQYFFISVRNTAPSHVSRHTFRTCSADTGTARCGGPFSAPPQRQRRDIWA
jgi:hypothetical protein